MRTLSYGGDPEQVGDLHLPTGDRPHPVAVLWHGGGFGGGYGRDMLTPVAADLARRGVAAWNVTYRRCGSGGGWPETFDDARAAVDALPGLDAPLDLGAVSVLGFSAGAALALYAAWAGGDAVVPRRRSTWTGPDPARGGRPCGGRGGGRVPPPRRSPTPTPRPTRAPDPVRHLPLGVPSLHVHGERGTMLPIAMTEAYIEAARAAGDDRCELIRVPGAGHMDVASPRGPAWEAVARWLAGPAGASPPPVG